MLLPLAIGFFTSIAIIVLWNIFLWPLGLFPIAALAVLPLILFSWRETLVWVLFLSLFWESTLPINFGSIALPLTATCLALQLCARHFLRSSLITQALTAIILQTLVTLLLSTLYPPRTFLGGLLQLSHSLVQILLSIIISLCVTFAFVYFVRTRWRIHLDSRVKDL